MFINTYNAYINVYNVCNIYYIKYENIINKEDLE